MNVILYFSCSQPPNREDTPTPQPSDKASSINQTPVEANEFPQLPEGLEKKPIVLKFSAVMDGITIGAALLPSLKAEYKMGRMKSHGMTGECERRVAAEFHGFLLWLTDLQLYFYILHLLWRFIKMVPGHLKQQKQNNALFLFLFLCLGAQTSFTFELPNHKLCFQSKVSPVDMSTMPPSASLTLPPVTMSGEYIMEDHESHSDQGWAPDDFLAKPGNYLQGNYLRCVAEVQTVHSEQNKLRNCPVNMYLLMCRLVHLSTTWPQTCSTTWSSYRRSLWRRSMRSFRRSQVGHIPGISKKTKTILIKKKWNSDFFFNEYVID